MTVVNYDLLKVFVYSRNVVTVVGGVHATRRSRNERGQQ